MCQSTGICFQSNALFFLIGNSMLLRVLPSVYEMRPQPIHHCLRELVSQMSHLDEGETHHMLRLLQAIAKMKQPKVIQILFCPLLFQLDGSPWVNIRSGSMTSPNQFLVLHPSTKEPPFCSCSSRHFYPPAVLLKVQHCG